MTTTIIYIIICYSTCIAGRDSKSSMRGRLLGSTCSMLLAHRKVVCVCVCVCVCVFFFSWLDYVCQTNQLLTRFTPICFPHPTSYLPNGIEQGIRVLCRDACVFSRINLHGQGDCVGSFERRVQRREFEQQAAQGPNVGLLIIFTLVDYFGGLCEQQQHRQNTTET